MPALRTENRCGPFSARSRRPRKSVQRWFAFSGEPVPSTDEAPNATSAPVFFDARMSIPPRKYHGWKVCEKEVPELAAAWSPVARYEVCCEPACAVAPPVARRT